jgi:hypothetical protein
LCYIDVVLLVTQNQKQPKNDKGFRGTTYGRPLKTVFSTPQGLLFSKTTDKLLLLLLFPKEEALDGRSVVRRIIPTNSFCPRRLIG